MLLDTDVISELRKVRIGKADAKVEAWARNLALPHCFLSVVTILELRVGIVGLLPNDPQQARVYQRWLDHILLPELGPRILPVDTQVALLCAELQVPHPRPYRDALIAATALTHDLTVVTGNVKDFDRMRVRILNPWA